MQIVNKGFLIFLLIFALGSISCSAKQAYVNPGDIVLWGNRAVTQNHGDYVLQMRLSTLQAMGKVSGIYDPIDPDLKTWDNTRVPLGVVCFWEHIELITYAGDYEYTSDYLVVLKPTQLLLSFIDINAAINKKIEVEAPGTSYNQPGLYVISKWILSGKVPWNTPVDHWAEAYGIDYENDVNLKAAQWSPCLDQNCHYNFADDRFWLRDMDCSSSTWWYLWYGYFCKGDPFFDTWLIKHPDWVHGSDCLAPGQVAEYLIRHKYVTIQRVYR